MSDKHTDGEWETAGRGIFIGGKMLGEACHPEHPHSAARTYNEAVANACLMAAAPDLLHALSELLHHVELTAPRLEQGHRYDMENNERVKQARAAIAKATGDVG